MCFSALASFSVSSLLIPAGLYCSYRAREKQQEQYFPLTLIPVLFGCQQALEGMVWLALMTQDSPYLNFYALGFLFFSHFLWLFWLVIVALELESRKAYK
jgi:heme A synthase